MARIVAMSKKSSIIEIANLHYAYGKKPIYEGLNLCIEKGSVYGVLGKNGVGKSTLINILMGYLVPQKGKCLIFGEDSHHLSNEAKGKIALLHEGFIAFDYLSIEQIEHFFAPFYPRWDRAVFYDLVDLMGLDYTQKLSTLSFGQKSQVVLGTLFAQNAELLILDDYSMGLDAGYRCLFIDYLKEYIAKNEKTVLITSHVMSDLVGLIDDMAIVQKGGSVYQGTIQSFCEQFKGYEAPLDGVFKCDGVHRIEKHFDKQIVYSFQELEGLQELTLYFEAKFLGFVGKY